MLTIAPRPPRVVEIVGPAGAGKTTLLRALNSRDEKFVAGVHLRKIECIPFFISNSLLFLSAFLRQYPHSRWFTWRETRSMIYLKAWRRLLSRQSLDPTKVTVFDHGPIFRLVLLREFGPEITKCRVFESWWDSTLIQWAALLDLVIWLDAPDAILMRRINGRNRWHQIKGGSEPNGYEFLVRYRTSYEQVISKLTARSSATVLRFDTDQESLEQIVKKVLAAFDWEPGKC